MGLYIETPLPTMKAMHLEIHHKGVRINRPKTLKEIPKGHILVCVVDNLSYEAAALVYDERLLKSYGDPSDYRRKTWLVIPTKEAMKLNPRLEAYLVKGTFR